MLFSKLKGKSDELLPPPPPFPSMDLEEKPKISEIKPKAKDGDFEDLFREVESLKSKERASAKKPVPQKPKVPKKLEAKPAKKLTKEKPIKKIAIPKVKEKPLPLKKLKAKIAAKLPKPAPKENLKDLDFILPKYLETEKELPELDFEKDLELPDTLEDLDIEKEIGELDFRKQEKPREVLEAEEEIKSAIENIKQNEKPSFLNKIFGKKEESKEELFKPGADNVSAIQINLSKARGALLKFDLETARRNYIEIMKIYNRINPEEQAKVYHDIRDLYFERKSAEELKV